MNIYVYWNMNDNDCKKIFHFMSPRDEYSIVDCLMQEHDLSIKRVYKVFDDNTETMENIQRNDLILFLTHGTEEQILKYRNSPERDLDEFVLIDRQNANILKDKIVLAFCCSSAMVLGRYCVSPEVGCKAYIGFEKDIVYDNGTAAGAATRHLIYKSYKIAFMKSLRYAASTKCSIEEYRVKLVQYMRREAVNAIMQSQNHSLNTMYSGTIEGVVALGKTDEPLFK